MKVSDLISHLQSMPQHVDVACIWDGEPRSSIDHVWLAPDTEEGPQVMLASFGDVVYNYRCRPVGHQDKEMPYWHAPETPVAWRTK